MTSAATVTSAAAVTSAAPTVAPEQQTRPFAEVLAETFPSGEARFVRLRAELDADQLRDLQLKPVTSAEIDQPNRYWVTWWGPEGKQEQARRLRPRGAWGWLSLVTLGLLVVARRRSVSS